MDMVTLGDVRQAKVWILRVLPAYWNRHIRYPAGVLSDGNGAKLDLGNCMVFCSHNSYSFGDLVLGSSCIPPLDQKVYVYAASYWIYGSI